jgi:hypothetical protein
MIAWFFNKSGTRNKKFVEKLKKYKLNYLLTHSGMEEKASPSGEDFSMLAVWRITGNRAVPFAI